DRATLPASLTMVACDGLPGFQKDGNTGKLRKRRLEQFQLFADYFGANYGGQPCDVPARPRKAGDKPTPQRVADHDNWNLMRRLPGSKSILIGRHHNDIDPASDELGRQAG